MKKHIFSCSFATGLGIALAFVALWLSAAGQAQANGVTIRYVATDGYDSGNCESVPGRCQTIQYAIQKANEGDQIQVAGGDYASSGTVAVITKELRIIGAFDPGFIGADSDLYETVLDAQWGGSVVNITTAGDVVLENLTITRGDGSGNCASYGCGGGIYSKNTNVHVINCLITNNVATSSGGGWGGGIYVYQSPGRLDLLGSQMISNTADPDPSSTQSGMGGGVYINSGDALLSENLIQDNIAHAYYAGWGGGISLQGVNAADILTNVIQNNFANPPSPWGSYGGGLRIESSSNINISGNRFEGNYASGTGGGINVVQSDIHLARNVLISNTAAGGGAFFVQGLLPVTLSNNLIAHNVAGFHADGIYASDNSSPGPRVVLVNNTIVDNGDEGLGTWEYAVLSMTNNIISGHALGIFINQPAKATIIADTNLFWNTSDPVTGTHGIRQDPLLLPDYHLDPASPAVNAGLTIPWLVVDLEGNPRPPLGGYDLGAFELYWRVYLPLVRK